jgi:proline iminopeptidase
MNRRGFLAAGVGSAALAGGPPAMSAEPCLAPYVALAVGDALNPGAIRDAGVRMLPVVGGKYKVWTKRVGRGKTKVLLLHGGPGFTHDYFEVMEAFLPEAGIEFYYYDQLGSHYSDQPQDPSLWTLPRFVEEVEEVRRGLGLENFVLYGHSWGGMLALEYALNHQEHLSALVISNMTAGIQSYLKRTASLKLLLPPAKLAALRALEAKEAYDSPEYEAIMMEDLYPQMICRLKPWPEAILRAFRDANQTIYNQMQGKSEFLVTGNLKDWERWDRLHEIAVPTLTIGAAHDEMDPADMVRMAALVQRGTSAICPNGSHLALWDDQAVYFDHLLRFLKTV